MTLLAGQRFADRNGLFLGLIITLSISCFIFMLSPKMLFAKLKTSELCGQDPWQASALVREIALKAKIPCPPIYLVHSTKAFAGVVGTSANRSSLFISEGLLKRLNYNELKAVIAYEIAVGQQTSCFSMLVAATFNEALCGLSQRLDKTYQWLLGLSPHKEEVSHHPFTYALGLIYHPFMKLLVNPQIYKDADKLASKYLESPTEYAQTLWKVQAFAATQSEVSLASMSPLFMVSPLTSRAWYRYFQSQPNLEERLQALVGKTHI